MSRSVEARQDSSAPAEGSRDGAGSPAAPSPRYRAANRHRTGGSMRRGGGFLSLFACVVALTAGVGACGGGGGGGEGKNHPGGGGNPVPPPPGHIIAHPGKDIAGEPHQGQIRIPD